MQDTDFVYRWAYNTRTWHTDEIIGKTDADLFAPEDIPGILEIKRKVLQTGEVARRRSWLTSNGQRVYLDCYYEPVKDPTGRIVGVGIAAVNLTEQQKAEEALRESEERMRMASEAGGFGTYYANLETEYLYWSPQMREIFGLNPQDATPSPGQVPHYIHPEDKDHVRMMIRNAYDPAGDGEVQDEHRILRPDGSVRWVMIRGHVYFDGTGVNRRAVRSSGIIMDITDRKKAEEVILLLNQTLEDRITQRTAEVQEKAEQLRALAMQLSQAETKGAQTACKDSA